MLFTYKLQSKCQVVEHDTQTFWMTFGLSLLSAPAELRKEATSWTSAWLASHKRLHVVTFVQEKAEANSCKSRNLKFIPDNWLSALPPNQLVMFVQRKRVT